MCHEIHDINFNETSILFQNLIQISKKLSHFVPRFSPIGICSLIAAKVAAMDDILKSLNMVGLYMATVIAGLLIHAIIIIPLLYLIAVRKNPLGYFLGLRDAIITAFGTSSRYMLEYETENQLFLFITASLLRLPEMINM